MVKRFILPALLISALLPAQAPESAAANREARGHTPELLRALDGSVLNEITKSGLVELPVVF
jgi:hypothetical protein